MGQTEESEGIMQSLQLKRDRGEDDGGEGGKDRMEGGVEGVRRKKGCLIRCAWRMAE